MTSTDPTSTYYLDDPERCDDCDIAAKYRTCYACGRSGLVLDCGHMPQPRHIAAGDHHDYCDDCYESLDA